MLQPQYPPPSAHGTCAAACSLGSRALRAGYARIGLTLGALACARQYPLLCVTTYFLA